LHIDFFLISRKIVHSKKRKIQIKKQNFTIKLLKNKFLHSKLAVGLHLHEHLPLLGLRVLESETPEGHDGIIETGSQVEQLWGQRGGAALPQKGALEGVVGAGAAGPAHGQAAVGAVGPQAKGQIQQLVAADAEGDAAALTGSDHERLQIVQDPLSRAHVARRNQVPEIIYVHN